MDKLHKDVEAEIPRLRRYARALCRDMDAADDLVQDCLARAFTKLHLWQEGTDLRAWLFTILHNQHVNRIRRAIREGNAIEISDVSDGHPNLRVKERQELGLIIRDLRRGLSVLPEEYRQILALIVSGATYDRISELLDIPVGTVRSRLARGRDTLRMLMGDKPLLMDGTKVKIRGDIGNSSTILSEEEAAFLGRMK